MKLVESCKTLHFTFNHFQLSHFQLYPGLLLRFNISDLIKSLSHVQRSLTQHLDAHKTQSQLDIGSWLRRSA